MHSVFIKFTVWDRIVIDAASCKYGWFLCLFVSVPATAPGLCQSCFDVTMINATARETVIYYKVMHAYSVFCCLQSLHFALSDRFLHFFYSSVIFCFDFFT